MKISCFCGKDIDYENNNCGLIINHFITNPHIIFNDNFVYNEELTKLLIETGSYKFLKIQGDISLFNQILKKYEEEQVLLLKSAQICNILKLIKLIRSVYK